MLKTGSKVVLLLAFVLSLAGCAAAVRHEVSPRFGDLVPYTVAVLPVGFAQGVKEDREASALFRKMAGERLKTMDYRVLAPEEVDALFQGGGAGTGEKSPGEMAGALNADAALKITITGWEKRLFVTYASLNVGAAFELHSSRRPEVLWRASYETKESDIRLDSESVELAVIKAYEPRVERFIDALLQTLPRAEPRRQEKRYFDWLP